LPGVLLEAVLTWTKVKQEVTFRFHGKFAALVEEFLQGTQKFQKVEVEIRQKLCEIC
jgi:hypothetical protein